MNSAEVTARVLTSPGSLKRPVQRSRGTSPTRKPVKKQHGKRLDTGRPHDEVAGLYRVRRKNASRFCRVGLTAPSGLVSMSPNSLHRASVVDLPILYRDEHCVAIDKPAGLLVHRSAVDRHETEYAPQRVRDQIGRRVYPVPRIDKPTSGVLLLALHSVAARRLTAHFTQREVRKTYLAVVRGHAPAEALIDYPLNEELDAAIDADAHANKPAQAAVTAYRRLATAEQPHAVGPYASARYSLLEVMPHTGRKHQIRRHMKHVFHPVIGDTSHGDGRHNRFFRELAPRRELDRHHELEPAQHLQQGRGHACELALFFHVQIAVEFLERLVYRARLAQCV